MLREIGLGNRLAALVARHLLTPGRSPDDKDNGGGNMPLIIKGTEGMVINFPKCCMPIPGDPVHGYVTAGRGIVVHHRSCRNVADYRNHPDKWIHVEWEPQTAGEFPTNIHIDVTNQRGVLAKIASVISYQDANILNVEMADKGDKYTHLKFTVEVEDRQHLAHILRRVKSIRHVAKVGRR